MREVSVALDEGVVFYNVSESEPVISFILVQKNVRLHVNINFANFAVFIFKRNRKIVLHGLGILFSFCFFNLLEVFPHLLIIFEDPEEIRSWNDVQGRRVACACQGSLIVPIRHDVVISKNLARTN